MIDSHCHVSFKSFNKDREKVVERALSRGVKIVDCAVTPVTAERSLDLSQRYTEVYTTVGVHPCRVGMGRELIEELKRIIGKGSPIAVGEIGLDANCPSQKQEEVFVDFLEIADELSMPAVLHCRGAEERCFELVSERGLEKVLFHCYSGSIELMHKIVEVGYFISIATNVIYSEKAKAIAREIPASSLLLETDSPYLSPFKEVKRNEPAFVIEALKEVALLRGISEKKLEAQIERNAKKFYGI